MKKRIYLFSLLIFMFFSAVQAYGAALRTRICGDTGGENLSADLRSGEKARTRSKAGEDLFESGKSGNRYMPKWSEGCLDVHFISTGCGNCAFVIMPDGTTMLVDAGEEDPTSPRIQSPRNTRRYPDYSRHGYQWQAFYIGRLLSEKNDTCGIDYAFVTHYHGDHYGSVYPGVPMSETGKYYLTGITGVGELIGFGKIVDRGWSYPFDMRKYADKHDRTLANYFDFIDYHVSDSEGTVQNRRTDGDLVPSREMKHEAFVLGSSDQFAMLRNPSAYGDFRITNISGNGMAWSHGKIVSKMPEGVDFDELENGTAGISDLPGENHLSCGILLEYGDFRFFMGADIPGEQPEYEQRPDWWDVESIVADAVGEVDVATANHHANRDAMSAYYLSALMPRVIIQEVWSSDHPGHEALLRMTSRKIWPDDRSIFSTNMLESNRIVIGELLDNSYESFKGHIVLRVRPGGKSYAVYTLNHETEDPYVTGVWEYETKPVKNSAPLPAGNGGYKLIAHRGGIVGDRYAEYDPESIKAAIEEGYYMLEIDVYPTADSNLVCHHDRSLKRIYGVEGRISDMDMSQIRKLKALKGGYSPLSFEDVCRMCEGRTRIMVDIKADSLTGWYCDSISSIMSRYGLAESAFFIRNDVEPYFGEGKYGFRISEIPDMERRIRAGEDVASRYYLFDHGNRINGESVKWCQKNGIDICASVNIVHYVNEDPFDGAKRDIEHLKRLGVTIFQIDSDFSEWVLE